MEIQTSSGPLSEADVQALAVAVFKDERADEGFLRELDAAAGGLVRSVRLPGPSSRPYGGPDGYFDEVADELEGALEEQGLVPDNVIDRTVVDRGEITFHIEREFLPAVAKTLRDDPALRSACSK